MADIVCIKIGQNEPDSYSKADKLSKHLDIIEVLPRKRDKDGNLIQRTMGKQADKHYLGLAVDMSHLNDSEFEAFRTLLKSEEEAYIFDEVTDEVAGKERIDKRLFKIDLDKQTFLDQETKSKISAQKSLKEDTLTMNQMDMMSINRFDKVVSFDDFVKMVFNKRSNEYLDKEVDARFKKRVL